MTTTAIDKLIEDAIADGYGIKRTGQAGNQCLAITKPRGRWGTQGVVIYPDGTAFCVDVDPSAAKTMRSYREVRQALGLFVAE